MIPVLWGCLISRVFLQCIFSPAKSNPNSCMFCESMFSSYNEGRVCAGRTGTAYTLGRIGFVFGLSQCLLMKAEDFTYLNKPKVIIDSGTSTCLSG